MLLGKRAVCCIISLYHLCSTAALLLRDLQALRGWYAGQRTTFYLYNLGSQYEECLAKYSGYQSLDSYGKRKHGGEVHFIRQLLNSPWRTTSSEEAKLFVVPLYAGWNARYPKCSVEFDLAWAGVVSSPQFKRSNGTNHILMSTDYKVDLSELCDTCILLQQGVDINKPQCTVASPMNSQLQDRNQYTAGQLQVMRYESTLKFRQRTYIYYFAGQADQRKAYRSRRRVRPIFQSLNDTGIAAKFFTFTPGVAGSKSITNYHQHVRQTQIGLHVGGDNPTSSRLYEWIDVGCPVVLMADGFYEEWAPGVNIPWRMITIQIHESLSDKGLEDRLRLLANMAIDGTKLALLRARMREYAPMLLWSVFNSVVAEMLLLDATLC